MTFLQFLMREKNVHLRNSLTGADSSFSPQDHLRYTSFPLRDQGTPTEESIRKSPSPRKASARA